MPRADRNKKTAMKALAEAAAKPGQSRITSIFTKTSSEEVTNEMTANEKLEGVRLLAKRNCQKIVI